MELVIVIGKRAKMVSAADAMSYIAGYTVGHDVIAFDWLKRNGGQILLAKAMDSFAPIGPVIVTADEIGDPHTLGIRCVLNGEVVQDSNTSQLICRVPDIVAHISRYNHAVYMVL